MFKNLRQHGFKKQIKNHNVFNWEQSKKREEDLALRSVCKATSLYIVVVFIGYKRSTFTCFSTGIRSGWVISGEAGEQTVVSNFQIKGFYIEIQHEPHLSDLWFMIYD